MSKMYKWLAAILGVLVLLFLGLVLFVRFYLTGELLAAWIRPPLEHYLHRNVTLTDAKVGFRGFCVEGLEIRKEGASASLLKGEELELRWKFRELLKGRIVIHTLAFTKPEITLIRQEDGSLNISDLIPEKAASATTAHSGKNAKDVHAGVPLLISLLYMEKGQLNFVDRSRQPQAAFEVSNLQSRITDFSASTPVPFQVEGQIADTTKGSFAINGTYDPAGNTLEGNVSLKGIDLVYLSPLFAKGYSEVIQQGNLTLEASLATEGLDHFLGQGSLNLSGLKIKQGEKLSQTLQAEADFQLDAVRSQETLKIGNLDLVINRQKAKVQGLVSQWHQRPQLDFTLISPQIKLDELLALLPRTSSAPETTETESEQTPGKSGASTAGPPEESNAATPGVSSSTKTMKQTVATPKNPEVVAVSPTGAEQSAKTTGEKVTVATETATEDKSTTKEMKKNKPFGLDAQGQVHIDWFHYNKLVASNVDCQLIFQDGKLRVVPLSASLYGGTLGGNVKIDSKSSALSFQSRIYTENILLDEIIAAFWPETSGHWSGNVNLFSMTSGSGSDLNVLDSRTDLNINEAEFSGHPLFLKLAELFQAKDLQQLRFSQVTARIFTKQGIATIKRLHLMGPIVQAEGTGTAGLLDKKLDLRLLLQIRAQYVGKIPPLRDIVTKISDEHGFVQLPLRVTGTFDEPVYGLDERWLAKTAKRLGVKQVKTPEKKPLPKAPLSEQEQKQLKEGLEKLVQ